MKIISNSKSKAAMLCKSSYRQCRINDNSKFNICYGPSAFGGPRVSLY